MNITLLDLIEYIKKHILMITITMIIAVVLGIIYINAYQSYVTSTTIKYDSVDTETGLDKDKNKVDPYEITSPSVIEKALKAVDNTSVEYVRNSITITPFIDSTTRKKQEALTEKGESYEYYPNEYTITLRHNSKQGADYGIELMNRLLESYDEYIRDVHTNTKKIPDIFTNMDYDEYDYMEICNLYQMQIDSILDTLKSLDETSPEFRSSKTGLTFHDLRYYFTSLKNIEYTKLYSYVRQGCLSKDRELLLKNYNYKIEQLNLRYTKKQEETDLSYDILIDFYKKYKEKRAQTDLANGSDNEKTNIETNNVGVIHEQDPSKIITTYDSIITGYVNSGVEARNAWADVEYYKMLISDFSNDNVSADVKSNYTKQSEILISSIDSQIKNFIDMSNETINDYNVYKGTQYMSYLSSVSTKASISKTTVVLFSVVAGVGCGIVIAIVIEVLKKLREEAVIEIKRKKISLVESGVLPKDFENMPPIDQALFLAISNEFDEFNLLYQPIVNTEGKWVGAEALVRWNSSEFGMVMPNDFITIAEKYDIMELLGKWILKEACLQCKEWNEKFDPDFFVSVNFNYSQIIGKIFMDCIYEAVSTTGVRADNIILEIANGGEVDNISETAKRLTAIKTFGVKVAIDNFNSEKSSVEALYDLPIDLVKLSRQHASNIVNDVNDQNFLNNIVNIANIINFDVCAEGVEKEEYAQKLIQLGVDYLQGFYYSKPVTSKSFMNAYNNQIS